MNGLVSKEMHIVHLHFDCQSAAVAPTSHQTGSSAADICIRMCAPHNISAYECEGPRECVSTYVRMLYTYPETRTIN